jgi:phage major head subunit gpT-like protein
MIFQNRLPPEFVTKTSPNDETVFMEDIFRWGARIRNNAGFGIWQTALRSNQPLTEPNYIAAKAAMRSFMNDEGKPMGNRPTVLVVGATNVDVALKLFSQTLVGGGDSNYLKFQGISIVEADRFLP